MSIQRHYDLYFFFHVVALFGGLLCGGYCFGARIVPGGFSLAMLFGVPFGLLVANTVVFKYFITPACPKEGCGGTLRVWSRRRITFYTCASCNERFQA